MSYVIIFGIVLHSHPGVDSGRFKKNRITKLGICLNKKMYRIYLSIYLSLSIHLSIHPSIYPSIHPFIYLFIYLSIYLSIYLLSTSQRFTGNEMGSHDVALRGDPPLKFGFSHKIFWDILGTLSMDLSGVPVKFHGKINPLILANAVVVVIF